MDGMSTTEHTEADRLLGLRALSVDNASISIDGMESDEAGLRSGRVSWGRKAGLAFAAFTSLGALGMVAMNAVRGGSADLAQQVRRNLHYNL